MIVEWKITKEPVLYPEALSFMEERVSLIHKKAHAGLIWGLEHPSLYTAGTSAKLRDLISPQFPVFETGRGGQYTYHGPGQRIYYCILNLRELFETPDVKKYIWKLEECIIRTLSHFKIQGERRDGRVGIWVICADGTEKKIAAIGVRIRHWVAYHGVSINLNPNLSHFSGIVPCGLSDYGVTSFKDVGVPITEEKFDKAFKESVYTVFNLQPTTFPKTKSVDSQ